ncbi:pentatricopeptide repeat-containing protein At4g14170 [Mercurialis annua]|uniref:pentatricopeptide repeat-containing protein At4g14170 n=1 Tax=Mercurialis annua TaxID=3986 RepID=UPI002160F074|nr:pentatricopeptide repeat-containing protein At4g14170 [Mercurialis annua]
MFISTIRTVTKSPLLIKHFTTATTSPENTSAVISNYFSFLHSSPSSNHLRHLHARLLRTALYNNVILSSKLVLTYSHHNKLYPHSLFTFLHMPYKNVYSWNIIIGEFSRSNYPEKAIDLFIKMRRETNIQPDEYSLPLVLRACAGSGSVQLGYSVHGLSLKSGFGVSLFVGSGMVFMYVTFGDLFNARMLFDEMTDRDSVLWTAMLSGYAQNGEAKLGLEVFRKMVSDIGVGKLDGVVMVSLVLVCGQLGLLKHGRSVHGWCLKNCRLELSLGNAIVDMYVKCAVLCYGRRVFDKMPNRDVFSYSSLILGYGLSGDVSVALGLFDQMHMIGIKPNDVTFLGVLSACAHGGLVEKAHSYFKMMQDCGLVAELKHCASMVDCLARAGRLEEAEKFINDMPMEPDEAVLGAILAGCRIHNNVEVGERIAKKLIVLKPEKAGYYVLLANMYASVGRFDEAEIVRDLMKKKHVSKLPGFSFIESKNSFPLPSEIEVQECRKVR